MQKKRCPFFFLDGRFESLVTLSLSDPSLSSSPSPICTSCVAFCASSLLCSLLFEADGVSLNSRAGVKGDDGSGRWPASPANVLRVGVFAAGSSARTSSAGFGSAKNRLFGRGVVGVVSSPGRACGGSGTGRVVVLTAWKLDMVEEMAASQRGRWSSCRVWCNVRCARLQERGACYVAMCTMRRRLLWAEAMGVGGQSAGLT